MFAIAPPKLHVSCVVPVVALFNTVLLTTAIDLGLELQLGSALGETL